MTTFTAQDIHSWEPIADLRYLPDDWSGTAIDILGFSRLEVSDRLEIVLREELIDARTLRLFAVWCARSVLHLAKDPRCVAACDVAERFAVGDATLEEVRTALKSVRDASWEARFNTTLEAARDAAVATLRDDPRQAAKAAATAAAFGEKEEPAGVRPLTVSWVDSPFFVEWDGTWDESKAPLRNAQAARLAAMLRDA